MDTSMSHTHRNTEEVKGKTLRHFNSPLIKGINSNYESANFQYQLVFLENYMYLC